MESQVGANDYFTYINIYQLNWTIESKVGIQGLSNDRFVQMLILRLVTTK